MQQVEQLNEWPRKEKQYYGEVPHEPQNRPFAVTFCFDHQQVPSVPLTRIGDAFYPHLISLYSFKRR